MYPQLVPLIFFSIAAAFTPGPNNILGSYSGFNFGIKKSIPLILGVTLGYTTIIAVSAGGLNILFNIFPILKIIIKIIGSIFLIYLAYKISFSKVSSEGKTENPVKFLDKFIFQFINPKGVMAGVTLSSNFVEQGENYLNHSIWVIVVCSVTAFLSITSWTFLGKFLRKFATNNNFIKRFNYAMSLLLIVCIIGFYI